MAETPGVTLPETSLIPDVAAKPTDLVAEEAEAQGVDIDAAPKSAGTPAEAAQPTPPVEVKVDTPPAAEDLVGAALAEKAKKFPSGTKINVRRRSGKEVPGTVAGFNDEKGLFIVFYRDGDQDIQKGVTIAELEAWNPEIANAPAAPAPETPPETVPANPDEPVTPTPAVEKKLGDLSPEQGKQFLALATNVDNKFKQSEQAGQQIEQKKFLPGLWQKATNFFEKTNIGKAIKIGGKIVLGSAAVVGAGFLAATPGFLAAPALYSLGLKNVIDGGMEAVQEYHGKGGKNRRLALESAREGVQVAMTESKQTTAEILRQMASNEINAEQGAQQLNEIAQKIYQAESEFNNLDNDNKAWENKWQGWRTGISTTFAIVGGLLHGIPVGVQDIDANKVSHAVRFGFHGFQYLTQTAHETAKSLFDFHNAGANIAGLFGHAKSLFDPHMVQQGVGTLGKIGIASGIMALFIKGATEVVGIMKNRLNPPTVKPELVDLNPPVEVAPNPDPNAPTPAPGEPPPPDEPVTPEAAVDRDQALADFMEETRKKISPEQWKEIDALHAEQDQVLDRIQSLYAEKNKIKGQIEAQVELGYGNAEALNKRSQEIDTELAELIQKNEEIIQELDKKRENIDLSVRAFDQFNDELNKLKTKNQELVNAIAIKDPSETPEVRRQKIEENNNRIDELNTAIAEVNKIIGQNYDDLHPAAEKVVEPVAAAPEATPRIGFAEADEAEKSARAKKMAGVFVEPELKEGEAQQPNQLMDFLNNAYRFPDRISIDGLESAEVDGWFRQMGYAGHVIEAAIDYWNAVQAEKAGGVPASESKSGLDLRFTIGIYGASFLDANRRLDPDKLSKSLAWSLRASRDRAEAIDREPVKLEDSEIDEMEADARALIEAVKGLM